MAKSPSSKRKRAPVPLSANGEPPPADGSEPKTGPPKRKMTKPRAKKEGKIGAKGASGGKVRKSDAYEPSDDEIRIRAYFIAERRVQLALEGDPANDWIEARRQLLDESAQSGA